MKIGNIEVNKISTKKRKCFGFFFDDLVPQGPDWRVVHWQITAGFWHTMFVLRYVVESETNYHKVFKRNL